MVLGKTFKKINSNAHLKEIFAGSFVAFILKIAGIIGTYIFTFLVSRYYGAEGMGVYSLSLSALLILEMCGTLGFRTSVLRFVGQFSAENKHHKINSLYKNILEIIIPVSLFLAVVLFLFSNKIAVLIFHNGTLSIPFKIISLILPIHVVAAINIEIIRGLKNIPFSEYLRNLNESLFGIPLLLVITLFVSNYYVPIATFAIATAGAFLISTPYVTKKMRSFSRNAEELLSKTELIKISLPMMITAFSALIMGKIGTIMIGMFSTTENAGIYDVALKLASVTSFVLYSINTIAAPKFSELYWSKNMEDLKKVVRLSSKLIFGFSFPVLLALILFPQFFMGIFGNEFIAGKCALVFLTIGQFVNASSGSVGVFLNMTGKQRIFRNIILLTTLINVILNYLLIPKYGINGAAIATMISVSFSNIGAALYIKVKSNIKTFYVPIICK